MGITLIDTMMSLNLCLGITLVGLTAPMNIESCSKEKVRKLVKGVQIIGVLLISFAMSHLLCRIRSRKCGELDDSPVVVQVVSIGFTFSLSIVLITLGSLIVKDSSGCDKVKKISPGIIVIGVFLCLLSIGGGVYKIMNKDDSSTIIGGG